MKSESGLPLAGSCFIHLDLAWPEPHRPVKLNFLLDFSRMSRSDTEEKDGQTRGRICRRRDLSHFASKKIR